MRFDVLTIFPEFFAGPFEFGNVGRGRKRGLIETHVHDLRSWAADRHRTVDDRPFGGGEGMVLKPEPIFAAVDQIRGLGNVEIIVTSAAGRLFDQHEALRLAAAPQVIVICGRYEGIDERVTTHLATAELSIGNFVLSGGEFAAAVIVDAVTRYVPGVIGKEESLLKDSFSDPEAMEAVIEAPQFTRPADFRGLKVPEVLISGNHEAVREWRDEQARLKTMRNRPDLLKTH